MGWITKNLPDGTETRYWEPDVLPEPTQEWRTEQSQKTYLKPDGMVTSHPGWFFGNGALATDEYFYFNHEWLTIIDEAIPGEIEEDGIKYMQVENPPNEWERTDDYKIKKTYKKYRRIFVERPKKTVSTQVIHTLIYNDDDLTATDKYVVEEIPEGKSRVAEYIREIRDYFLFKTDYIVIVAKEKGLNLSEEIINYRQFLRDVPYRDIDSLNLPLFNINDYRDLQSRISILRPEELNTNPILIALSFVPIPNKLYDDPIVESSEGE